MCAQLKLLWMKLDVVTTTYLQKLDHFDLQKAFALAGTENVIHVLQVGSVIAYPIIADDVKEIGSWTRALRNASESKLPLREYDTKQVTILLW